MSDVDPVKPLSPTEQHLVKYINDHWTRERALDELTSHLQVAIEVELATIPVYLLFDKPHTHRISRHRAIAIC
jgi:hypothetical protein